MRLIDPCHGHKLRRMGQMRDLRFPARYRHPQGLHGKGIFTGQARNPALDMTQGMIMRALIAKPEHLGRDGFLAQLFGLLGQILKLGLQRLYMRRNAAKVIDQIELGMRP